MSRLISTSDLHNVVMKRKTEYGRLATLVDNTVEEMVRETPTANAIRIPDNATNGEVIMAVFKEIEYYSDAKICASWWNAPYKGAGK